ncbi:MAG: nitrogen fixation protein NifM [Zetaproteobacteria bacterium CG1_02_49_23]|nr:MAG: nitrogen fixation protein NifM [Zetaproteobacteria bacterium CG1_02_49_23]
MAGETVIVDAVDSYLLLNAAAQLFEKVPADLNPEQRQQAVVLAEKESLMLQRILASDEAGAIEIGEDEIVLARSKIEERYPSRHDYLEDLVRNGMNEATLSLSLAATLKVEKVMQQVASVATVSDDEVAEFYSVNPDKFSHAELREARHILITINKQFPENRRKAVKARMKKIVEELAEKPDAFADLAMRYSECPTALEGGFLGKLPQGKLYAELDSSLFVMGEGEVSEILESPMGMHLLRCDRIHPADVAPLEEAAPMIREYLLKPRISKVQKQWIRSLFAVEAGQ